MNKPLRRQRSVASCDSVWRHSGHAASIVSDVSDASDESCDEEDIDDWRRLARRDQRSSSEQDETPGPRSNRPETDADHAETELSDDTSPHSDTHTH